MLNQVVDLTPEEQVDLHVMAKEAAMSTPMFALLVFPDHFSRDFCELHRQIAHYADNPALTRCALAAPRGFGKTTFFTLGLAARRACYQLNHFIVIVSATLTHAKAQLRTLRIEFETNEMILALFGDLKGPVWNEDELLLSNGVYIVAKGAGQQIRGLKYGQYRPDLILIDDLEEAEAVLNEDRRQKLRQWFISDLVRSGANSGRDCEINLIGTILHEDSLLQNLLDSSLWESVRLEACDDNLKSNWPEFLSDEDIRRIYDEFAEIHELDSFYREYRNLCIATENKLFGRYLHYGVGDPIYEMVTSMIRKNLGYRAVIVDPARTAKITSDHHSILGALFDFGANAMYFHELWAEVTTPDLMFRQAFEMADRMHTNIIAIEEDGLHLWMTTVARTAMISYMRETGRKDPFMIVPLRSGGKKKEDRIVKLAPLYNVGAIYHNKAVCAPLEAQLDMFPRAKRDDCADVAAYCVSILIEKGFDLRPNDEYDPEDWRSVPDSPADQYWRSKNRITPADWNVI